LAALVFRLVTFLATFFLFGLFGFFLAMPMHSL
jgi:hypothetical protein